MAKESRNYVKIVGYLKDNTLALGKSKTGEDIISGSLTVLTDDNMEFRLFYYSKRWVKMRPGDTQQKENIYYKNLSALLPEKTTFLSNVLLSDPSATADSAKKDLTRVTCIGAFEERFWKGKSDELNSMIDIRGREARIFTGTDKGLKSTYFSVEPYVQSVRNEMDKNGEETGRVILTGILTDYFGTAHKITFIANNPQIASAMSYFELNNTYPMHGYLSKTKRVYVRGGVSSHAFGDAAEGKETIEFVDERIVSGGDTKPLMGGDYLDVESVKAAMDLRNEKMNKAKEAASVKSKGSSKAYDSTFRAGSPTGFGDAPMQAPKASYIPRPAATPAATAAPSSNDDIELDDIPF